MRNTLEFAAQWGQATVHLLVCTLIVAAPALRAGTLYVSTAGNGQILSFTSAGVGSTFASGLNQPEGLAFDSSGNLFEVDSHYPAFGTGTVNKFTPGGVRSTFASGLSSPVGLAFDSGGNLFVGDPGPGGLSIYEYTPGGARSTFGTTLAGDLRLYPIGLAFDSSGNLFESDPYSTANTSQGTGHIYKYTPGGVRTTFASGLDYPTGMAFDSSGNLYAVDSNLGLIYKFTSGGIRTTFSSGYTDGILGLTIDESGDLYVSDQHTNSIYEITPGGVRTTFASGLNDPTFLAYSAAPEPATQMFLAVGLAGLLALRKRLR
jgi:sugar lactone lactonase YvrE